MTPFDKGYCAARKGLSRKSNPYDIPDRQPKGSMKWEMKASEWDEGFDSFDLNRYNEEKTNRAKHAAKIRWNKL